ncbi:molybdopterin cofactor-binding domain-containing protein [Lutimaribacter marinistellae]|uniref:Molybdopterin cofactor-binding domain-containing protein n=1 Tax=Lutimaribacter marinistellae TaxID=1820329 RepID=A0ABV7TJ08_9RHOB
MASVGKILRRTFLIGSAAIVGGVAFGVYKVRQPAANPLAPGDGAALNPFVMINGDGITLIAPRAEMGQGVRTTWAALIAEELDVGLDQVRVIHGPAAKAYYNSALIGDALPGRGYDKSDFQHNLGEALGEAAKLFSLQVTGGSTSMKDGFERMRAAGASARETLKAAAAERLGVPARDLRTQAGRVIAPDGTEIAYTDLAAEAARLDPVETPLRDPGEWRLLGADQPRVDMIEKATGTAQFGIDVRLPGMKFAAIRRNPAPGGGMAGFDDYALRDMPGVEKVVDIGDGVAVISSNTWLAQRAVDAIEIAWTEPPYPAETDALFDRIAAAFEDSPNSTMRDDGDADTLPQGATELTAEYRLPYLAHATMEPMTATALISGDGAEIWTGTQAPTLMAMKVAGTAGIDTDQVTVHTTYLGGGFGRRAEVDFGVIATLVAMEMPGTPVQTTWSREEDMRHDFYRPAALARMRGGVQDGKAVLLDAQVATQSPTQQITERMIGMPGAGPDKVLVEGLFNQPYAIPAYRARGHIADLSVPVGFWRSVGNSHNAFFVESFIDEMAHAAGRDPLDFRLELMRSEHEPSARCIEAVREMSGWTGETPDGVGRGVAFCYSFGTPVAQVIEVVDRDGSIHIDKAWIACDIGLALDPRNVAAQMEGGMIYGLSAACFGEITFADGAIEQGNFPDYEALRMHTTPKTQVQVLENNKFMGGAGEPGTPPAAPALANAIFDLTGKRARSLPLMHAFDLAV